MPANAPEEIHSNEMTDEDAKKFATRHSDEKFDFPKGADLRDETKAARAGAAEEDKK